MWSSIIEAYHARRVALLMTRMLPLYVMAPEASFDGMALTKGALPNSEIVQCIKEAMEPSWDDMGAPSISSTGAGASFDAARARPCCLHKFHLLLSSLQVIPQPLNTNFERGGTSQGTSSSRITWRRCRGIWL